MKCRCFFLLMVLFVPFTGSFCYSQSPENAPVKLRVATYNVGHFNQGMKGGLEVRAKAQYPKDKSVTENYIQQEMLSWRSWIGTQSLDFFAAVEWNKYFDQDSTYKATEELLKPYFNHIYFGDEHTWIYNGIATNYHLTNIRQKYWYQDYYALMADFKIGNTTITFISTHIPWQKKGHGPALDSLVAELKTLDYFICCGDMNASDADQLKFLRAGFNMANGGFQGWFTTAPGKLKRAGMVDGPNSHIDNIITSKTIKIMNVTAPHTGLNDMDHLPVIADLVVTR